MLDMVASWRRAPANSDGTFWLGGRHIPLLFIPGREIRSLQSLVIHQDGIGGEEMGG